LPHAPERNSGTWQYWDLLGQVAHGIGHLQPRKGSSTIQERLEWKLKALRTLRDRGIWLVDAAVTAFYAPGGKRPFAGEAYAQVVRESRSRYVWPSVRDEPLEAVWIIGRAVAGALRGQPELARAEVVSQPQDRNAARYRDDARRMVAALTRIR
jgi:hypothetical protein